MGHSKSASSMIAATILAGGVWATFAADAVAADNASAYWAGPYVGIETGLASQGNDWKATSIGPNNVYGVDGSSAKSDLNQMGGRLGGYAGWNFPVTPEIIAGAEADFAGIFGGKKTSTGIPGVDYQGLVSDDSISARADWDASVRGRLGYAVDRDFLVYGTAGVAFQDTQYKAGCPATAASWCGAPESASLSKTNVGWTAGAGAEARLTDDLSVRIEYRYDGFSSTNLALFSANQGADSVGAKVDPSAHLVSFGLTYKIPGL